MGNSGSANNSENEEEETSKDTIEEMQKDHGDVAVLDLTVLFEPKQLRVVADKIKEDTNVSPLQQHHTTLIRWLEERRSRGAETVTLMQFVDTFTNKGVSKEIATKIFQQFDIEGSDEVDLDYLHEMLDLSSRSIAGFSGVRADLQAVNTILQDCSLAPGFIDAFTSENTIQVNHGQRLFKFLSRNRALSVSMPVPALKGFITSTNMRLKVLKAHLHALKEKADSKKQEPPLQADEVLKPINRCFTSAVVSSNYNDASKLLDNDNGTYWQSDGPARSHWVRLTIPPNVVIKLLSMYVVSSDQSYMPHHVVVHGGRDEANLRELNDVRIPNHITGDFNLLENLKIPYQMIQISIKRCHSDGCDTRIRQIKAVGYRVVKSKGVSVMDATAMWYLSVLASTAQAALPVAPDLRDSIIAHTKVSLAHMSPLSLSASSSEKPGFLSRNVMEQMESFLHKIIRIEGGPVGDELLVLLQFALARGSLGSILDVLKLLIEKINQTYPAVPILKCMTETEEKAVRKHGQKLQVNILCCDGGLRDPTTKPSNVLSDNWKTDTYYTATGKTKCNMAFGLKSGNLLLVTKVYMKLAKGVNGPKSGLVFVFDSDDVKDESGESFFQPLEGYDTWTEEEYKKMKESGRSGNTLKPHDPVAFFNVEKDWTEVDLSLDFIKTGSCIVVKFLGPRQESAERLGIFGINIIGYEYTEEMVQQQKNLELHYNVIPEDEEAEVSGITLFLRCLKFLQTMAKDAVNLKVYSVKDILQEKLIVPKRGEKKQKTEAIIMDTSVDINDISMEQVWNIHDLIMKSLLNKDDCSIASEMLLSLFHTALPYLRPAAQRLRESRKMLSKGKKINTEKFHTEANSFSTKVFQALCDIVDKKSDRMGVHKIAKSIILDGAEVFFPDADARRSHLLTLVDRVMEDGKAVSLAYTFESLCRFFSNKDASGLLGLPDSLPQASFKPESVIHVMKTLVSVAHRECLTLNNDSMYSPSNIVLLLCAMQKSLLAWCHIHCANDEARPVAVDILYKYVEMVSAKSVDTITRIESIEEKVKTVDRLEYSFVSISMRQLILFLNLFSLMDINGMLILRHLQPLAFVLSRISKLLPQLFTNGTGLNTPIRVEDTTLREWEVESEHDYADNMNYTKVFNCPGCTCFKVDFDERCRTEKKYDYLEFTDSSGRKRRFDEKTGTMKWPLMAVFEAGERLHFLFHSDGSNTSWGYKFKVSALGTPDVAVTWICDLQLILSRCFGMFCSASLNTQKALGFSKNKKDENDDGLALGHSELWGSLFRGGYMVGKLERSLSGCYRNNPSDSSVNSFLLEIASTKEEKTEKAKEFLAKCKELYKDLNKQPIIGGGGEEMETVIHAVFAALIWHTQELREIISPFVDSDTPRDIPQSIMNAYTMAEKIRAPMMLERQLLLIKKNDQDSLNTNQSETVDPDAPVISCREKALFLLRFAGLSKFSARKQSLNSVDRRISVYNRNQRSMQDSAEQKKGAVEQKKSSFTFTDENSERYPSFSLVLDFVTNASLSHHRIHELLKHRCKYAQTIASVYTFVSEYIERMVQSEQTKIPCLMFLQSMLMSQDSFPRHYGDYLNGCGLELETSVRKSFYGFVRKLSDLVGSSMDYDARSPNAALFKCAQAYLLHILDVEWKSYDFDFITDLDLPYLLISCMQASSITTKDAEEQNELLMYERHRKFFKQAKAEGIDQWCKKNRETAATETQRDINLFIARYSSDLEVMITCDGCSETIKGRRHRCLNCVDMDLCATCYRRGAKPFDHTDQHELIDLKFTCDNCNAFIVETRIHCNDCSDFDLCLGCHKNELFPECHSSKHSVSKSRLIAGSLHQTKSSSSASSLESYIHHHSWLQFCALALALTESLQSKKDIDPEYSTSAINLLLECMSKVVNFLIHPKGLYHPALQESKIKGRTTKVTFEEIETVINISSASDKQLSPKCLVENDADTVSLFQSEDPTILHETISEPISEPRKLPDHFSHDSDTNDDDYFSMITDTTYSEDISSQRFDSVPPLESDDETVTHIRSRDNISNIGIDQIDEDNLPSTSLNKPNILSKTDDTNDTEKQVDPSEAYVDIELNNMNAGFKQTVLLDPLSRGDFESTSNVAEPEVIVAQEGKTKDESEIKTEDTSETNVSKSKHESPGHTADTSSTSESSTSDGTDMPDGITKDQEHVKNMERTSSLTSSKESTVTVESMTSQEKEGSNKIPAETSDGQTEENISNLLDSSSVTNGSKENSTTEESLNDVKNDQEEKVMKEERNALTKAILQEKLLGLLGSIIPVNRQASNLLRNSLVTNFVSTKLLPVLFTVIRDAEISIKLRTIALGVLAKSLLCFGPQIADVGVRYSIHTKVGLENETKPQTPGEHSKETEENQNEKSNEPPTCDVTTNEPRDFVDKKIEYDLKSTSYDSSTEKQYGIETAEYLFNLGAEAFKNSDLDAASGIDTVLKNLWCNKNWEEPITNQANRALEKLSSNSNDPSLLSLFSLMFLAGFPDVFRRGCFAQVKEGGDDIKKVVVLDYSPEQPSISVVNFKSRKKQMVSDLSMEPIIPWQENFDKHRLPLFIEIIKKSFLNQKCQSLSVERMWVLSLVCKALLNILKSGFDQTHMLELIQSGIIPYFVNLACQGTGFSNQWLLRDLEVLSWRLYKTGEVALPVSKTDLLKSPQSSSDPILKPLTKTPVKTLSESLPPLETLTEAASLTTTTQTTSKNDQLPTSEALNNTTVATSSLPKIQESPYSTTTSGILAVLDEIMDTSLSQTSDTSDTKTTTVDAVISSVGKSSTNVETILSSSETPTPSIATSEGKLSKTISPEPSSLTTTNPPATVSSATSTTSMLQTVSTDEINQEITMYTVDPSGVVITSNTLDPSIGEIEVVGDIVEGIGPTSPTSPKSPLDGLDEETKLCMETIHDALFCPYSILRAIYEHFERDKDRFLEEVQRSSILDGTSTCSVKTSDEILELAKTWEKKVKPEEETIVAVDSSTDVGVMKFHPQKVEFKDLRAKPEGGENLNKLISSLTETEITETRLRQRRNKSSELLQKELEKKQRENTREFTRKLNHAVAVGYSRHLVGWLFASWPVSENIFAPILDNINAHNIVGLLDLIQSVESKQHFQKVVHNFIRCCNKTLVQPLALSAVQCMGEVRLATETRESEHKYRNNSKVDDKVHIPGATSLFIKFDERCSTEQNCDELVVSSSPNYQQNRRTFSGSTDWNDFEMPGDTIYYRFTSDSSNNDWGWKFTVTGGQLGRFETGCSILNALLGQDLQFARRLPLKQLWSWLIVVACNQVGQQRLMATGLLLKILQISAGDPFLFGEDIEPTPEKNRPNLSLLRPLWTLYTNSIESDTGTSLALISPVIRGLSELFLVVENVAQEWGEADDLVAGLATDQKLRKCFTKVVTNIAAIGMAINLPNKALDMLQNARQNTPPPPPASEDFKISSKKRSSRIELRITRGDSDDFSDIFEEDDGDLTLDDDEDDEDDDDDDDSDDEDDDDDDDDDTSDLSTPEIPPI